MRAIILCGGSGSRLWPESRKSLPKQFIPIFEKKSLLDLTIERIIHKKIITKPIFICNQKHGFLVKESLEKYNLNAEIFLEPEGKNTCAAIYLAAKYCSENEKLLIMPSDHLISDNEKFINEISNVDKYLTDDCWVTLGIKPTKPSEAYGYIKADKETDKNLYKVSQFIEKPSKETATKLIKEELYYWNAGIFFAKAKTILNSVKKFAPNIANKCDSVFEKIIDNKDTYEVTFSKNLFSHIPSQSIDYAVMEKENNIYLYPLKCEWSDVGSWDTIAEMSNVKLKNNQIMEIDSNNNFIRTQNRVIATIGVSDLIIIDNDNATLISKKNQSEKVKLIVNKLIKKNVTEAIEHTFEKRPWGRFENLYEDKKCKVKRLLINPNKRLSLQFHNFRSEHWLVVFGSANIHLDGENFVLYAGQSVDIPLKSRHYIENKTNKDLIIIETQLGTYFGEDDIVRIDDPYSR